MPRFNLAIVAEVVEPFCQAVQRGEFAAGKSLDIATYRELGVPSIVRARGVLDASATRQARWVSRREFCFGSARRQFGDWL